MFEDIKRNKMKSWIIVLLFLVFIALIIYYICMASTVMVESGATSSAISLRAISVSMCDWMKRLMGRAP